MNKLKMIIVAGVMVTGLGVLVSATSSAQASNKVNYSDCKVTPVGTENTANRKNSKFTVKNGKVTGKFKVSGKNCKEPVSLVAWTSPNKNARPLGKQRIHSVSRGEFKSGVHTLTTSLPDCFYQVDMVRGAKVDMDKNSPGAEHYGNKKLLGFVLGGKKCVEKEKKEWCPVEGKEHLPVSSPDCEEKTTTYTNPKEPEVPEELPETGVVEAVSQMFGASSLAASGAYYLKSRRELEL